MIPLAGLSTRTGLALADATRDRQVETIRNSAEHKRAIKAFEERIGDIKTVDQLMEDRELYVFVMKAHGLEDQIFGKAMISKILKSDPDDPKSLLNRLTDPRFRELHKNMGFGGGGEFNVKTFQSSWRREMVDRYVNERFTSAQADQNEAVGTVLEFRQKAASVKSWFDVLKDASVASFMRTALGLPKEAISLDIDKQAALFESKFDLKKLKDPAELEKLERKFVAITDAQDTSRMSQNAALQLMAGAVAGGQFVPITLDISAINSFSTKYYR